jgi:predicted deacetylase
MKPSGAERRSRAKKTAIVSIHDVMPSNLDKTFEIIRFLKKAGVHAITLLIVAGLKWQPHDIALLEKLHADGEIELAGHGWKHRIDGFGSLMHRLHGVLISRKEAEHLSLASNEIVELVKRNHNWFQQAGLAPPALYVPPAWAMGKVSRTDLKRLPFRYYETLTGVYDSFRNRAHPMAVCGYMADAWHRSLFLRASNAVNEKIFTCPLRIAIHPDDLYLLMAADLAACLNRGFHFSTYEGYFAL